MNAPLALLAWLLLPFAGLMTWRLDAVRRMPLGGRIAVAGAAGALAIGCSMFILSLGGVPWTRLSLGLVFVTLTVIGLTRLRQPIVSESSPRHRVVDAAVAAFVVLTIYGALDARESSGDLHYFWGPKAVRFYRAERIDTGFLRDPTFYSMHPDYPPLLPLLYVWSSVVSHSFSWWVALLSAPLLLLATAAVVRSFSHDDPGTLLIVATLAQAMAIGYAAGAADPLLVFFEALALAALTFIDDERAQSVLAAIGLAGAAWTKIEGTTFAIAVIVALVIVWRRWRRTALIAAPAGILLGAWTAFIAAAGMLDMYGAAAKYPMLLHAIPKTLVLLASAASYNVAWLPWIAPLVLIVRGDVSRARLPLIVCALTLSAAVYFYIHVEDPTWWIASSAHRVLLTPLVALDIAAIAASTRRRTSLEPAPIAG